MIKRLFAVLPAVALLLTGFYFVFATSPFVRYWVDDFCSAAFLRSNGFIAAQLMWWNGWTGRYSATAFTDFFELFSPWAVRVLPIVILGLLIISLKRFSRVGKMLPVLFIFLALVNAPNIIQSFYWQTGSLTYVAPFIFLNLFLSQIVFPSKGVNLFLPAILLFIAGGFSEAYALAQLVLLFFILIAIKVIKIFKNSERVKVVISGIIGAGLALGIMSLSPGNIIRATSVTYPESLNFVITSTLFGTKWYIQRMLSIKPFIYSLFLLFTSILVLGKRIKLKVWDAITLGSLSLVTTVFTTTAVLGSGFYSMAIIPPERTLFIAIYMILICFVVLSLAVSSLIKPSSKFLWLVILLNLVTSLLLIKSVILHWNTVRFEVRDYAREFDNIEPKLIESAGKAGLDIKNIKPVGELDSFTDNKSWVASCLAGYYQIKSVKIVE